MPVQVPQPVIDAFVAITRAAPYPAGPIEADMIVSRDLLHYYTDVEVCLKRQLDIISVNFAYLTQLISVFDDTQLQAVGIFNNKTVASPPNADPVMIINSTYFEVLLTPNISSPPAEKTLTLLGNTSIGFIILTSGTILDELYIGPGVVVDVLDASSTVNSSPPSLTSVGTLWLPSGRSKISTLKSVTYQSIINQVVLDEGSYYGGIKEDPALPCAQAVTGMTATETVKNGVFISWTLPAASSPPDGNDYLFINTFYKKSNSPTWIVATTNDGDFIGDTGFTFRYLEPDTFYDFKAVTTCINGGTAENTITIKTGCCSSGGSLVIWKKCELVLNIVTSPTNATQTLCNGAIIASEYPVGTTLTVPYLIGRQDDMDSTLIVNNTPYQLFPFNNDSGTWDASSTPLNSFIDGNVVTAYVNLPM